MAYRNAPTTRPNILELRPEAEGSVAGSVVGGSVFTLFGVVMVLVGMSARHLRNDLLIPLAIFGMLCLLVGVRLLWIVVTAATTRVRLVLDEHALLLAWYRRGRIQRSRRVDRDRVRGASIEETHDADGEPLYRLVLETTDGNVALDDADSPRRGTIARRLAIVTGFLAAEPRPEAQADGAENRS